MERCARSWLGFAEGVLRVDLFMVLFQPSNQWKNCVPKNLLAIWETIFHENNNYNSYKFSDIFTCRLLSKHFCLQPLFPQRFSLFSVCLAQWFRGVAPWQTPKEKCLKFRSADLWKMHFSWIFLGILEFIHIYKFPSCVCKYLNQRVRRIGK